MVRQSWSKGLRNYNPFQDVGITIEETSSRDKISKHSRIRSIDRPKSALT
jgi:hypothetical protein